MVKESASEEHMAREYSAILGGYVSSKELFSHLEEGVESTIRRKWFGESGEGGCLSPS